MTTLNLLLLQRPIGAVACERKTRLETNPQEQGDGSMVRHTTRGIQGGPWALSALSSGQIEQVIRQ
jgi:hypothetical protein